MLQLNSEFTEKVRAENEIEDVTEDMVSDFKGFESDGTTRLKCLCPFHQENNPSFTVYVQEQQYHCFGCGKHGDVFNLVQELKGVNFVEARNILADMAGIPKPQMTSEDAKLEEVRRSIQDALVVTAEFYHQALLNNTSVLGDLKTKRAWSEETIKGAKLGLAQGSNLGQHLSSKGLDLELAKKAGVLKADGSDFFHDRLVIPYFQRGRVVYMSGRSLDDSRPPKYLNLPVNDLVKKLPFNADALYKTGDLIIVEGFADALTLKEWGYNVISVTGTSIAAQECQALKGHTGIYICLDSDDTGKEKAVEMAKQIVNEISIIPYIVELPQVVKDPNDFAIQGHSQFEFETIQQQAISVVDILIRRAHSCQGATREQTVKEVFQTIYSLSEFELVNIRQKVRKALSIMPKEFDEYMKATRSTKKNLVAESSEEISDNLEIMLHPALEYVDDIGVVTVALYEKLGSQAIARPYLVTSYRELLKLDGRPLQINGKRIFTKSTHVTPDEVRWNKKNIDKFLRGDNPDPVKTYLKIASLFKKYVDFKNPIEIDIVVLWCMGSYIYYLFSAYAYINFYGVKGTGKTQVMTLSSYIAFNAMLASSISASALFRLVEATRCTVGLDEAENLRKPKDPDSVEILRLLKAGYKKGAAVHKTETDAEGNYIPKKYEVYSPKMIASISGIEDILGSRCISINMLRTKNAQISKVELSEKSEDWDAIRHELYCFALLNFTEIRKIYLEDDSIKILQNRDNELWLPLFSIAKFLDKRGAASLLARVMDYAKKVSGDASDSALGDFDAGLIQVLEKLLGLAQDDAMWVSAKEIGTKLRELIGDDYSPQYSFNSNIGRSLKNFGFFRNPKSRRRHAWGFEYHISKKHLLDVIDRYGIKSTDDKDLPVEDELVNRTLTDEFGNTEDLGQIPMRDM